MRDEGANGERLRILEVGDLRRRHDRSISLNCPDQRNAQNRGMLVELDEAFARAESDDNVRVVVLAGEGPMFSSGHDIGSKQARAEFGPGPASTPP